MLRKRRWQLAAIGLLLAGIGVALGLVSAIALGSPTLAENATIADTSKVTPSALTKLSESAQISDAVRAQGSALTKLSELAVVQDAVTLRPAALVRVQEGIHVLDRLPDSTPPAALLGSPLPGLFSNSRRGSILFSLSDPDNAAGLSAYCSLDGTPATGCTSPFIFANLIDGRHSFSVYGVDPAGNRGSPASYNWTVDTIAPSISGAAVAADGSAYVRLSWTNQNVTVSFTCADGGSGVAGATPATTLTAEGAGQQVAGTCTDKAGNSSGLTVDGINIDKTAPAISFLAQAPAANAHGWNNTDVTLSWACSDALSGARSQRVSVTISTEGADQAATGVCTDVAGNTAASPRAGVNIDKTAPILTPAAMTADGRPYLPGAWTNQDVTITFSCTDPSGGSAAASGMLAASLTPPVTKSGEGANQAAGGDCSDLAGNAATHASFAPINIDKTPPVTSATALPGPLGGRQLVTATATVSVAPGGTSLMATCFDSSGLVMSLSATDSLSGATGLRYGIAKVVPGQPLPTPTLTTTSASPDATVSFLTTGIYVLGYAGTDRAGNQEATKYRWIFVEATAGVACVTSPLTPSALPRSGTVTLSGTIRIGIRTVPIWFSFSYRSPS